MSSCTKISDFAARETCEDQLARIDALEKKLEVLTSGDFSFAVETMPAWIRLSLGVLSVVVAIFAVILLWKIFRDKSLKFEEATVNLAGNSITFKAATQKINQLLSDIQDHVIGQAAQQRHFLEQLSSTRIGQAIGSMLPDDTHFNSTPAKAPKLNGINILWVSDNADTIVSEQSVLKRMGNSIHNEITNEGARKWLKQGNACDLVISDVNRPKEDEQAGIHLFGQLFNGIKSEDGGSYKIGTGLRFAFYTLPQRVTRYKERLDGIDDAIITSDFVYLQSRVRWLQQRLS